MDNGNLGQYESHLLLIKVLRAANPAAQAETVIHELCHAYYDQHFSPESTPDEEEVVRFMSRCMVDLLMNNGPDLMDLMRVIRDLNLQPPPNLISGMEASDE